MEDYSKLLTIALDQPLRPDLKYFSFRAGRVQASNIRLWLDMDSSLAVGDCNLPAAELVKALSILNEKKLQVVREDERILLTDGRYSIKVPIIKDDFPAKESSELDPAFLFAKSPTEMFKLALAFIGDDQQAPFTKNLYCMDGVLWALQRAMVIGFDIRDCFEGKPFDFELMKHGVAAAVNSGEEIMSIKMDPGGSYIYFDSGAWIYSVKGEAQAPDFRSRLNEIDFASIPKAPEGFEKAIGDLDQLSMLSQDKKHFLYFSKQGISTAEGEFFAAAEVGSWPESLFSGNIIGDIASIATHFDFSKYPAPVPFRSEDGRAYGIFMGMKA
jgi:hypothetical protein